MEKKLYNCPLVEVEELKLSGVLLTSPDDTPLPPPDPGMPARKDVF